MSRKTAAGVRNILYVLLFIAATFAVLYVVFWTEEESITRKPAPPDTPETSEPARPDGRVIAPDGRQ